MIMKRIIVCLTVSCSDAVQRQYLSIMRGINRCKGIVNFFIDWCIYIYIYIKLSVHGHIILGTNQKKCQQYVSLNSQLPPYNLKRNIMKVFYNSHIHYYCVLNR